MAFKILLFLALPALASAQEPAQPVEFEHAGITAAWKAYADVLTFGKGQTLALLDDGCTMTRPEWQGGQGAGDL